MIDGFHSFTFFIGKINSTRAGQRKFHWSKSNISTVKSKITAWL